MQGAMTVKIKNPKGILSAAVSICHHHVFGIVLARGAFANMAVERDGCKLRLQFPPLRSGRPSPLR
jgi:hypothetical protein